MSARTLNFINDRDWSKAASGLVIDILKDRFPWAVAVTQATEADDKKGIDYFVQFDTGRVTTVDCKIRKKDYRDLALEIYSVKEQGIVGWTLDTSKLCDYVLFHWLDTKRSEMLPFLQLVGAFSDHVEQWARRYPVRENPVTTYGRHQFHSQWIAVPSDVVWAAIREKDR